MLEQKLIKSYQNICGMCGIFRAVKLVQYPETESFWSHWLLPVVLCSAIKQVIKLITPTEMYLIEHGS